MRGSEFPDSNGYVANGYVFACYNAETYDFHGWYHPYIEVKLTKISSSVEAPAKQNSKKVNVHRQSKLIWKTNTTQGIEINNGSYILVDTLSKV